VDQVDAVKRSAPIIVTLLTDRAAIPCSTPVNPQVQYTCYKPGNTECEIPRRTKYVSNIPLGLMAEKTG